MEPVGIVDVAVLRTSRGGLGEENVVGKVEILNLMSVSRSSNDLVPSTHQLRRDEGVLPRPKRPRSILKQHIALGYFNPPRLYPASTVTVRFMDGNLALREFLGHKIGARET